MEQRGGTIRFVKLVAGAGHTDVMREKDDALAHYAMKRRPSHHPRSSEELEAL